MKLLKLALLSLAAFSNPVQALQFVNHIPHGRRQAVGFNSTTSSTATSSVLQITSSSTSSITQAGNPSTSTVGTETLSSTSINQLARSQSSIGISSVTGESRIGSSFSTTSDETSSQISAAAGSTLALANGTTQITALVTTTDATTSQSSGSSSFTGALTPSTASTRDSTSVGFNIAASGNQTRTVFTASLSATPTGIRSFFSISNVSISASPSGNYTNGNYSGSPTDDGGGDYVTLTLKGGYEPPVVCISTTQGAVPTTWSIVYTTTTTIFGDPTDYTPPEPEITIPITCSPAGLEEGKGKTKVSASVSCTSEDGVDICTTEAPQFPTFSSTLGPETTVTFVTTAKNPSVVFSPISTPRYGHDPETQAPQDRRSSAKPTAKPTPKPTPSTQSPNNDPRPSGSPRESAKEPPKATYMITVAPTKIVINDQTFTQNDPSGTTKVTVNGDEFTINPSEVIGGGTIVDRPGNVGRSTMVPSSTVVGDLPIVIAPAGTQNVVVVGGTTFGVQATPITAVVEGQTITIEPSAVIVPDQNAPIGGAAPVTTVVKGQTITLVPSAAGVSGEIVSSGRSAPLTTAINGQKTTIQPSAVVAVPKRTVSISRTSPVQTEIVVAGGEMITAIGPSVVVIRSTTFTYGLVSTVITKVVDDDTISIGPSGVSVRNTTVGGPGAKATDTTYEIVGGASVTQVGASVVVVDGTSFTVGPGKGTTTKVFGGETITIGPSGVVVSTITLPYPFGPTVITTIDVPSTAAAPSPVPSETKKNGGGAVRPARALTGLHLEVCIAIGVWVLGHIF
ncbi:uncharacterized protein BDZ83DRAFT_748337 [Colletotrichum acutatum]|uniref:Uncharacterized protein n=1 Tax=Glomerella acutata TaxID=27357 RepID=A0AAD9D0X7_GLOAC|nr:uncharacterized protein BDZ83DRAFT_748337 [Colletotrichum acutatum]KAK1729595.1 hypothetical protein BDZ83DRAFT_748337 [Colletotrichum acutatum]